MIVLVNLKQIIFLTDIHIVLNRIKDYMFWKILD